MCGIFLGGAMNLTLRCSVHFHGCWKYEECHWNVPHHPGSRGGTTHRQSKSHSTSCPRSQFKSSTESNSNGRCASVMSRGQKREADGCKSHFGQVLSQIALNKKMELALAGVAQWSDCWSAKQRVASLIPSQGTCLGCGPGAQLGAFPEATTHWCFSPSFSLPSPLSKNK